ncbi:MAG TPA: hypothetical protein VHP37_22565 [Burkholderiales bacterium]|nr:hypothetical protein [Burkholderiales bacterium]
MSERDDAIEVHNLTVKGLADAVVVHLEAGNFQEALRALEQAVAACESHPSFAKFATSHCKIVEQIVSACAQLASRRNEVEIMRKARDLSDRMHVLDSSELH